MILIVLALLVAVAVAAGVGGRTATAPQRRRLLAVVGGVVALGIVVWVVVIAVQASGA